MDRLKRRLFTQHLFFLETLDNVQKYKARVIFPGHRNCAGQSRQRLGRKIRREEHAIESSTGVQCPDSWADREYGNARTPPNVFGYRAQEKLSNASAAVCAEH